MTKIIVLDIETDGGFKIIQISYIITCCKLNILSKHNYFLNDGSNTIDFYKKITEDFIKKNGKHPSIILKEVAEHLKLCETIIGHNIQFDIRKLTQYFYKYKIDYIIPPNIYDTMKESKNIVKAINIKGQIKYPKLEELSNYYGIKYDKETAHDGLADVMVTFDCYKKIINNKELEELNNLISNNNELINIKKNNNVTFIKLCDSIFYKKKLKSINH